MLRSTRMGAFSADYCVRKWLTVCPDRTIFKKLLLPDGDCAFKRIDQPAAGVKSSTTMRCGHCDQHAGLADFQTPDPVHNGNLADRKMRERMRGKLLHLL